MDYNFVAPPEELRQIMTSGRDMGNQYLKALKDLDKALLEDDSYTNSAIQQIENGYKNIFFLNEELENDLKEIEEIFEENPTTTNKKIYEFLKRMMSAPILKAKELYKGNNFPLHIQLLNDDAIMPKHMGYNDAGLDLYTSEELILQPFEKGKIKTDIAIAIPPGYKGIISLRSSVATETPLIMPNGIGVIDSYYTDEILLPVLNISNEPYKIEKGIRLTQLMIEKSVHIDLRPTEDIKVIDRNRAGGFGSTDINIIETIETEVPTIRAESSTVCDIIDISDISNKKE